MKTKSIVVQLGHQLPENVLELRCVRVFCDRLPNRRRWTGQLTSLLCSAQLLCELRLFNGNANYQLNVKLNATASSSPDVDDNTRDVNKRRLAASG